MRLKEIKNKIALTQNISEITRVLELVSAVKMKKAQGLALNSRPFTEKALEILERLSRHQKQFKEESVFFQPGKGDVVLAVAISSDKGFCGAFNKNILNFLGKEIQKEKNIEIFAIGKKAIKFFKKKNSKVLVEFYGIGDFGEAKEIKPIANLLIRYFKEGRFQKVILFYTDFISTFSQKPVVIQLLPLDLEKVKETLLNYELKEKKRTTDETKELGSLDYIFEPSSREIFENLVPQLIEYLIYHSILEANAAEHSARMLAMRAASENAKEIMGKLRLDYNKARQSYITAEVLEVSMAKEVLG